MYAAQAQYVADSQQLAPHPGIDNRVTNQQHPSTDMTTTRREKILEIVTEGLRLVEECLLEEDRTALSTAPSASTTKVSSA